jgi:hypothetical protein
VASLFTLQRHSHADDDDSQATYFEISKLAAERIKSINFYIFAGHVCRIDTMAAPASASQASSMHMFTLPPPALAEQQAADATTRKKRRTSQSTSTNTSSPSIAASVTLPPPPTRTRKIIQMKPTPATTSPSLAASTSNSPPTKPAPKPRTTKAAAPKAAAAATTSPTNAASAAATSTSRKVARKTAHSLIERRRRSKMNAEFESLKNLVPACKGVEMHKLAILQASIEYVRYLEGCVKELQKASGVRSCCEPPVFSAQQRTSAGEEDEEESGEDVDMEETEQEKDRRRSDGSLNQRYDEYPHYTTNTTPSSAASVVSATSPDFGPIHSATTSPIFTHPGQGIRLPSISPMLFPQPAPACHSPMEATAGALLLLADEGRRESVDWQKRPSLSRGMSVKDLLSS